MSEIVLLSNVRLSFPNLVEPQKNVNEKTGEVSLSYNAEFIMDKDSNDFQNFMKRYSQIALDKWGENAQKVMQLIHADRKLRCYGEGEEKVNKKTFEPYKGYEGKVYITTGRKTPPQIIQSDGSPIDSDNTMAYNQLTRKMYGGCRVNAAIKPWPQDNKHGRGIRCELIAIQFAADDEAFGAGETDASGMFGAVSGGSTASGGDLPPFMQ